MYLPSIITDAIYKRIKPFVTLLLLTIPLGAFAQPDSTAGSYFIDARLHGGFLIAHRPSLVPLQQNHLLGFDVSAGIFTNGSQAWHKFYNYPSLGLKYIFLQTGNADMLGNAHALVPFFDVNFTKRHKTKFGLQFGWGVGYVTKKYTQYDNYKNAAIGSGFNSTPCINFFVRKRIADKNYLSAGIGVTHFSNGSVVTPNLGINLATANICYRFSGGDKKPIERNVEESGSKKWEKSVALVFGVKQNYPAIGPDFFITQLSLLAMRQFKPVSAYGLGVDLLHDPSITQRLDNRGAITDDFTPFRPGVNASYSFKMGNLTMLVQQGFYVYSQLTDDGILYQRLGLRYHVKKRYFAAFNLKTHFAKADFFEWGGGVRF